VDPLRDDAAKSSSSRLISVGLISTLSLRTLALARELLDNFADLLMQDFGA
jgi:hypothetical protein